MTDPSMRHHLFTPDARPGKPARNAVPGPGLPDVKAAAPSGRPAPVRLSAPLQSRPLTWSHP